MASYRPDIDGLRAVAVLSVVFFHAGVANTTGGYVGVDVFFVISGYLITRIIRDEIATGQFSIVSFYERRARRILPALFFVIAISLAATFVLLPPYQFEELSKEAISAAFFYANIRYHATSDYFAPDSEFLMLLHTWSLAVEEQFYIVFPLVLLVAWKLSARAPIVIVLVLSAASLTLAELWLDTSPTASFYLSPARAWELGIGASIALWRIPRFAGWLREALAAAGLAMIALPVMLYSAETPFPGLAALAPCIGAGLIIATGLDGAGVVHRLLSLKPLVFVGLISYSLYLWHWPALAFARNVKGDVTLEPMETTAALVFALLAAIVSWAFVERPFRKRGEGGFSKAAIFRLSGASMAAVALVAGTVRLLDMQPPYFDENLRFVADAVNDKNPDRARCFSRWPASGLCRFGAGAADDDGARADFILWGDSHADAMMPGVAHAAREAGKTGIFAGISACLPLLGFNRIHKGRPDNCAAFNEAVMADLEARDDARLVILAGRWPLSIEGRYPPGERGGSFILQKRDAPGPVPKDSRDNFEIVEAALAETIARIRATGREIVIIGSVPEPGWSVPLRLIQNLQWGRTLPDPPARETVAKRNARTDALFARAARTPGVRVLSVIESMCDTTCHVWRDGRPLYYDNDHLSAFGALHIIAPLVLPVLTKEVVAEGEDPDSASPDGDARN